MAFIRFSNAWSITSTTTANNREAVITITAEFDNWLHDGQDTF